MTHHSTDSPPAAAAKVLRRAAELVTRGWTQEAFARTANGEPVRWNDGDAVCYCLVGAYMQAMSELQPTNFNFSYFCRLMEAQGIEGDLSKWNDSPFTTQKEIVARLESAAANLESEMSE